MAYACIGCARCRDTVRHIPQAELDRLLGCSGGGGVTPTSQRGLRSPPLVVCSAYLVECLKQVRLCVPDCVCVLCICNPRRASAHACTQGKRVSDSPFLVAVGDEGLSGQRSAMPRTAARAMDVMEGGCVSGGADVACGGATVSCGATVPGAVSPQHTRASDGLDSPAGAERGRPLSSRAGGVLGASGLRYPLPEGHLLCPNPRDSWGVGGR